MLAVVIDDDEDIREDIAAIFPKGDVSACETFASQADFVEQFLKPRRHLDGPCLFLVDVRMEESDSGIQLLKQLRKKTSLRSVPIVMISQSEEVEDVRRAYDNGASYYVVKGTDPNQLSDTIGKMIDNGKLPEKRA